MMDQSIYLFKYLKMLSRETAHILDKMWADKANIDLKKIPVFKNGRLVRFDERLVVNSSKINRIVRFEKNIVELPSFQLATNLLKQILKSMDESNKLGKGADIVYMSKEEICNFITQYNYERYNKVSGSFQRTSKQFRMRLESELSSSTYITPLYNVAGNFSEIVLSEKTRIRAISDREYLRMINFHKPIEEISDYEKRLRFVIEHHADVRTEQPLDRAKEEYAFVTNLVRLTLKGAPEFGQIYLLNSAQLDVLDITRAELYESTPRQNGFVALTVRDRRSLILKYLDIGAKINKGKKAKFLANSIARFGMASRHKSCSNKIVDYVIALESLLIESHSELTLKLAHRVSALCGNNDDDRLYLWEFIKMVYKYRSGVVHESTERPFVINSNTITIDEVSERLGKITATAILRMVSILDTIDSKSSILQSLDRSIYDKNLMAKLHKLWK